MDEASSCEMKRFKAKRKMVHYHSDRVWYPYEWERYLHYGQIHCALLGYDVWIQQEHQSFDTSMRIFDDEERWLRRPENLFPLCEKEWSERRALLASLQDQFVRYVALIRAHDQMVRQNVANANFFMLKTT